ncbi:MAG: TonB-dependent receptor [Acidobacteria bacterium]|nr:TonB-dependent receptor [Acidobacteriota bacterium]
MNRKAWGVLVGAALVSLALLALLWAPDASAQTFRGTILGTVTDQSGAVVPDAKVKVKNADTGLLRETQTAEDGSYSVPELPIGTYTVTVEKAGFQVAVTSGIRVEVAAERRVEATLKAGDVKTVVEVSGEDLAVVETTSNVLGGSFESKMMLDLPVNGRDYTKLLIMVPGAAGEPNGGGDSPGSYGLFSVNGNRGRSNNFLLDGTDMNDGFRNLPAINQGGVFGTPGTVLPMESVAELKISSNSEPEFGRNSGAVVNIVTKSGTNTIHGSALWFFRDDSLNARNYFNDKPNPKDQFRNHQYGFSAGGPLEKDKTFWYVAYEGQREDVGVTSVNTVPMLAEYAAAITTLGGNAGACTTTIFACITANGPSGTAVVNPVIFNLFSLCNTNGRCSGGKDVWPTTLVSSAPAFNRADSFILKLDYNWDDRNQLTGRYFFGRSDQSFPLGVGGGNNLPGTNTFSPINAQFVAVSYVHVFSPTKTNELRFGWNRYHQDFFAADREVFGNPRVSLGLNTEITNARDFGLPSIRVSGAPTGGNFAYLGAAPFSGPKGRTGNNVQAIDGFSWKAGSHDWKFGYEFRRTTVDSFFNTQGRGILKFDDLTAFLAGTPTSASSRILTGNTDRETDQNSHAIYVQDSWRVRRNLTFGLGLRWDYFGVVGEKKGRFSTYDPASGLRLVDPLYDKDYNNFSPRVSFAWDISGKSKTVLRGGVGLFYDTFSHDMFTGQIPYNCFSCPGVAYNPIGPDPVFVSLTPMATLAVSTAGTPNPVFDVAANGPNDTFEIFTVEKNLRTPYVITYSLNLQQELFGHGVLQVGYVGSGGRSLLRYRDINQPDATAIRAYDYASNGCCVPRPFDSAAIMSPLAPNPPFYVNQLETSANSIYHSLQASFQQRAWRGLTNQVAYTWSHSIDNASDGQDFVPNAAQPNDSQNARGDRGNSNFDVRHRLVWSLTYAFPKWEAAKRFGEGWEIASVVTLMSGHPFHINYNFLDDYDGSGEFFGRPDVVSAVRYNRSNPRQFLDLSAFKVPCTLNPAGAGFAQDCTFTAGVNSMHFGTLGRNALLGPDYKNMDFAIIKETTISERWKLNLRVDIYNLFNHPNFANPYMPAFFADAAPNFLNPATGVHTGFLPIVATSDIGLGNPILGGGGPRSVQFAMKVIF